VTPSPPTKIHEIFSSIQGEGPWSGRPCVFIRLFGCNSNCKGCDTPQASPRLMQPAEILDAVPDHPLPIVITGGEPCLQAEQLRMIAVMLPIGGMRPLALETNGTIPLDPDLVERFDLIVVGYTDDDLSGVLDPINVDQFFEEIPAETLHPKDDRTETCPLCGAEFVLSRAKRFKKPRPPKEEIEPVETAQVDPGPEEGEDEQI